MEHLRTLLIANRGEIAVRIIRTAESLKIKTISIYSKADAASHHVSAADESVLLEGPDSTVYTDSEQIIRIAKDKKADAIAPGYGFLSENADFARAVKNAGIGWVGPSGDVIDQFAIKHKARALAEKAGVPIVPGTKELVEDEDAAVKASAEIGYPVMLKLTGGGGGMGLVTCETEDEVRKGFKSATSRGEALYKNAGVFIEKYFPASRHIEVQVFGNGKGKAIHFGERECSIQRRHQKVIEECPSPFVSRYDGLRQAIGDGSVKLAESVNYASAGTVEYILDEQTGGMYFLEMNTRLQVEHGITELCYRVDLVELMLRQADAELAGKGGLDAEFLETVQAKNPDPRGFAIEARVYAENPVRDFAPSPGTLQEVNWVTTPGARIDTWVTRGTVISPNYDPLIAKVMFINMTSRAKAVSGMYQILRDSSIKGPPTNLEFLASLMKTEAFATGQTLTTLVDNFSYAPPAIDVISAGAYTLVQDYPGRPSIGKGIPHSGPMDPVAIQVANALVGNPLGKEALEITLTGPELRFIRPAVVALCGAQMEATLEGSNFPMWTRIGIDAGQTLKIGKLTAGGCRAYLAVYGGFPSVAEYFGSKATSPLVSIGGYQGRSLAPGDLLGITEDLPENLSDEYAVPEELKPKYSNEWEILTMVGPHDEGFLLPEDIEMLYSTTWEVSHNANRSGIRLLGPVPKFAREHGGQGGSHPSNVVEYGYPVAALNWTGDDPCIFPFDCPNFGGFISSTTIIRADWWKMGQLRAGDKMRYKRVSFEDAVSARKAVNTYLSDIEAAVMGSKKFADVTPLDTSPHAKSGDYGRAILAEIPESGSQPLTTYRQGGDSHIIVYYGDEDFNLNHRCRVTLLEKKLYDSDATPADITSALVTTVGCCTSLTLTFDPLAVSRDQLLQHLQSLESDHLGDLSQIKIPTRKWTLPISFESKAQDAATKRYMETQRPHAPYLPDNLKFVAENNAFTPERLKQIYTSGTLAAVVVGFFCGNTVSLPVDPRERMSSPKTNPSRVETPSGTVGWGGSCCSIYPVTSPGGYQMTGRTVPIFDMYGWRRSFKPSRPWLFEAFDLLTFRQVSEGELDKFLADFDTGTYEFVCEDVEFDMGEHNKLLRETAGEVAEIRRKQLEAQRTMQEREKESLEKWREEKKKQAVDPSAIEELLKDDKVVAVEAPVNANVWKVLVDEGDEVEEGKDVVILEAMKLEVAVKYGEDGPKGEKKGKVVKVVARQGETCSAGDKLVLLRT